MTEAHVSNVSRTKGPIEGLEYFSSHRRLNLVNKAAPSDITIKIGDNLLPRHEHYQIQITDCSHHIYLHGRLDREESRANAIKKLNALIVSLTEAREHIRAECERLNLPCPNAIISPNTKPPKP